MTNYETAAALLVQLEGMSIEDPRAVAVAMEANARATMAVADELRLASKERRLVTTIESVNADLYAFTPRDGHPLRMQRDELLTELRSLRGES